MNLPQRQLALILVCACLVPTLTAEAHAAETCPVVPLTQLQQRLIDKAAQGVDALRNYISITSSIYQLNFVEVVVWMDLQKQHAATCQRLTAEAAAQAAK
jgi:hypothetical protein